MKWLRHRGDSPRADATDCVSHRPQARGKGTLGNVRIGCAGAPDSVVPSTATAHARHADIRLIKVLSAGEAPNGSAGVVSTLRKAMSRMGFGALLVLLVVHYSGVVSGDPRVALEISLASIACIGIVVSGIIDFRR